MTEAAAGPGGAAVPSGVPADEHLAWIDAALEPHGLIRLGTPDAVRERPWSRVWRIATTREPVWFKVNGGATRYEAGLLQLLAQLAPVGAPRPLAVDASQGWSLLRSAGSHGIGPADCDLWATVLAAYASTQRAMEVAVPQLLAAGVPDHRARGLPRLFDELLADDAAVRRSQPGGLDPADEQRLRELRPQLADWCAELADSPVADTIQHDDLHGRNVLVDSTGRTTIVDWGDASVAPPFATLLVTMRGIARDAGLAGPDDLRLAPVRDAYLAAWADVADPPLLSRLADLAVRTGCVGRALSWHRALVDASPDELEEWGEAVPGWLAELR